MTKTVYTVEPVENTDVYNSADHQYSVETCAWPNEYISQYVIRPCFSEQLGVDWNVFGLWNMRITESL